VQAAASLPAIAPTLTQPRETPLVLVDGAVEPRLELAHATIEGPLDQRRITLLTDDDVPAATRRHWRSGQITVVLPQRLSDDQCRWPVLAAGTLHRRANNRSAGQQRHQYSLIEPWQRQLEEPSQMVPWVDATGRLIAPATGAFQLGATANRSTHTHALGGSAVHVLQQQGEPWTVGSGLRTLAAVNHLGLSTLGLPRETDRAPLTTSLDLARPVGELLAAILEPYGLVIARELARVGGSLRERRTVRPVERGRPIAVHWRRPAQPVGDVLRINAETPTDAAQRWIGEGQPWLIESTFELVGGWDPALAGESDATYDRTNSSNFSRYGNVYRQWVLNEDGAFTGPPHNRGEPFDLASFFNNRQLRPQPLRFEPCVTLDDNGQRIEPVIEVSTDDGPSWSRYGGEAVVLSNRAGVYLNDTTLPGSFLTAAKNDQARLRVTAGLRSPVPVRVTRWRGNPFAGRRSDRVFDLRQIFSFQRVENNSIHRDLIDTGTLEANEMDQTQALQAWLVAHLQRSRAAVQSAQGQARLTLSGTWWMLRPGARLLHAGQADETLDGAAQAVGDRAALVESLTLDFSVRDHQGPTTTVHVRY
jgi:hypothetical protein